MNLLRKLNAKRGRSILIFLMTAVIVFNIGSVLLGQKEKYLTPNYWERYAKLKHTYENSQYATKNFKGFEPDEIVYAYAGGAFLLGVSPVLIVPDAPPLGKYLISLSVLFFRNEHVIILISGFVAFLFLFLVGRQVLSSTILALIPPIILSSEPLFKNMFVYTPLFDIMQLVMALMIFYFFNKGFMQKKNYLSFFIAVNFLLGCFIATKFFVSGITFFGAWFLLFLLRREKTKFLTMLLLSPIPIIVLLASYARVFAFGYTLREIVGIQKWVFIYHQGQLMKPFSIWPLLFLNQWHVWWGDKPILSDSQWIILWPVMTTIAFLTIIFYVIKKLRVKKEIEILMVWIVLYLGMFSIGQITVRYFIILLPIIYIVALYGVQQFSINQISNKK